MREIEREIGHFEGKPVMVLRPADKYDVKAYDNDSGKMIRKRFIIKLDDLWKYSDTHNEHFDSFMPNQVMKLCTLFSIPVPEDKVAFVHLMASVADVIMGGIDELVSKAPYVEGRDDPRLVVDLTAPDMPELTVRRLQ